jgi:hypothetical protein
VLEYDQGEIDDLEVVRAAFPEPDHSVRTVVKWFGKTIPGPGFRPYLIKFDHWVNVAHTQLAFRFHKTDGFTGVVQTVNLEDENLVWRGLPSTLDGLGEHGNHCAILFFTSKLKERAYPLWVDGCKPRRTEDDAGHHRLAGPGTGGTGKWPITAGVRCTTADLLALPESVRRELLEALQASLPPLAPEGP